MGIKHIININVNMSRCITNYLESKSIGAIMITTVTIVTQMIATLPVLLILILPYVLNILCIESLILL